ncbi:MAG: non-ribosomal peptide synthetase [Mucilaginibacter sp.]|nr:non-ribosomal peptide synthetase [Mucilaginibacter sp.]
MRKSEVEPGSANSSVNYEVSYETSKSVLAIKQVNELEGTIEDPVSFWKQELNITSPFLDLPVDFTRSSSTSNQINHVFFSLSASCWDALKQLNDQLDTNLFTILLAAYNTLLFRYTKQEDIIVGFPSLENNLDKKGESKDTRLNTKLLRANLSGNPSFNELLKRVQQTFLIADKHKGVSYATLEKAMKLELGVNYTCLYNVIFSYRNTGVENNEINDLAENTNLPENYTNNVDLALSVKETKQGLKGVWTYNSDLFEAATIKRIAKHFEVLLEAVSVNPQQTISQLQFLTDRECHQLTKEWNISKINYPFDKCIHELFEEQAKKTPNAKALIFDKKELTYRELNERSNQLARYLRSKGVKPETLVPLCIGRSLEMIVGILAILKAGGAYVPIDPNYPAERIAYLLEDTKASLVVCNHESKMQLRAFENIEMVEIGGEDGLLKNLPVNNLNVDLSGGKLAYIIYTSGTTGKPKGVMIEHKPLLDHCFGIIESANLKACKSFALFSPLVFDAGHSIIHSCFILGASLHVLPEQLIMNSEKAETYINNNSIDCVKIVPSLWLTYANLQRVVLPKRVVIFGGEAFPLSILRYLKNANYVQKLNYGGEIYNHYGPTEVTIGKCIYKVNLNKTYTTVPIGKPFSNTQFYVLDDNLQLVPVGVEGELYIAGDGLARGYLNNPNITAEKFVFNPFANSPTARMYKTGDKVRWLSDGNIEYRGRLDEQVKIQGYRIELGEIEHALLQSGLVSQVAVLANTDKKGKKLLAAYIVPAKPFTNEALKAVLRKKLPEYMVPVRYIELECLPLTRNGKIDKKALENLAETDEKYIAPSDDTEVELASILRDLLNIEKISIHDNFFELGGNSIIAVVLFARIKKKFHKDFPLATIFETPTIHQLALALKATTDTLSLLSTIVPIQPNGSKTPLFCIHAGRGDVLFYGNLSLRLGADQPFYGIQAKGINGIERPILQMEQMAAYYINELRKVQPEGPYYLGGYCFGAQIAFEMAQQLTRQGQKVALLASFNGISQFYRRQANVNNIGVDKTPKGVLAKVLFHFNKIMQLRLKEKILYIPKKIKNLALHKYRRWHYFMRTKVNAILFNFYLVCKQKVPGRIARFHVMRTVDFAQSGYRPTAYQGSMVIFRSPGIYTDPYLGWQGLANEIQTFDIPGMHEWRRHILSEPHVQFLAKELKNFLDN